MSGALGQEPEVETSIYIHIIISQGTYWRMLTAITCGDRTWKQSGHYSLVRLQGTVQQLEAIDFCETTWIDLKHTTSSKSKRLSYFLWSFHHFPFLFGYLFGITNLSKPKLPILYLLPDNNYHN